MVLQTATPTTNPPPHVVGNAFVHQYYHVLLTSPDLVHRFYQDSSILTRPNSDEEITPAINDKLLSYNFNRSEIESIDSQASYHSGVMIVVTGCLTGNDNSRRKFTQSFFLAPQDNGGFFVLNDIFRFLDQPNESNQILTNGNEDAPNSPPTPVPEPNLVQENHVGDVTSPTSERVPIDHEEVVNPSEHGSSGIDDEVAVDPPVQKQSDELPIQEVATLASSVPQAVPQDDGNKKSYASIVKVMNGGSMPRKSASVPTSKSKIPVRAAMSSEKLVNIPNAPAPTPETRNPGSNNAPEKIGSQDAVEGHSIYIRNLPQNATPEQVERELKKFGSIKPGGVQVRNHKIDRFCFGFVEFESESAMQDAIKASPITMEGRRVFFEEKRTTTRGNCKWCCYQ
ncbi:putative G3BP-like protein [Iris pallida]|uniref:G3BP-like protein n=1 Tax=Iris pallida TaxID=29817 RepID=A0AAX6HM34_IRIPA|nr:putative G3BP-like protein [Iris pallida]